MLFARALIVLIALNVLSCLPNSLESDAQQGTKLAEKMEQDMALANDPVHSAYLQKVGDRLESFLPPHPLDFQFRLLDSTTPNAFSLPGGFVYASRGLMAMANTEDELAGVLAHEIVHVMERHGVRKARQARPAKFLNIPGKVAKSVLGDGLGNLVPTPLARRRTLKQARYSRELEYVADREGMELMARAGYRPQALLTAVLKISLINSAVDGMHEEETLLSSHPYSATRAATGRALAETLAVQPGRPIAKDYLQKIDGLPYGEDSSQGVWRNGEFLAPRAGVALKFPPGWKTDQLANDMFVVNPESSACLVLTQGTEEASPSELGKEFTSALRSQLGQEPTQAIALTIGKFPAYLVTITDTSGESPAYLHFLWIRAGKETSHLMAMGTEDHRPALAATVKTIRPLAASEYESITRDVISFAQSVAGETLTAFGLRTGNHWRPEVTAAMNGLDPDEPLTGQRVKILARRPLQ